MDLQAFDSRTCTVGKPGSGKFAVKNGFQHFVSLMLKVIRLGLSNFCTLDQICNKIIANCLPDVKVVFSENSEILEFIKINYIIQNFPVGIRQMR